MKTASVKKLPQDCRGYGADRFADADFLCGVRHAHQHNIHDADFAARRRAMRLNENAPLAHIRHVDKGALERVVCCNLESFGLIRA